jgi:chromosome segregation ATPase
MKIQELRSENSIYVRERTAFEERVASEGSRESELELKLQDILNENMFLLRKISVLENTLKSERYQMQDFSEKFKSSLNKSSTGVDNKNLEERQQLIFELQSLLESNTADAESLKSQISNYENIIENQKIRIESILKKFQDSNADNEFLIKKIGLLSQTLRNYQFEIESMTGKLRNAKTIIAQLHAELARGNSTLANYQAALASAYLLNGELMTKIMGFSTLIQFQTTSDSKLDLLNLIKSTTEAAITSNLNTSTLLEATGSETYCKYINIRATTTESGNV